MMGGGVDFLLCGGIGGGLNILFGGGVWSRGQTFYFVLGWGVCMYTFDFVVGDGGIGKLFMLWWGSRGELGKVFIFLLYFVVGLWW